MKQPTESFPTNDETCPGRALLRPVDQSITQTLMVPFTVVVRHALRNRPAETLLAERNQSLQALVLDRKHRSLREGVQIRTPGRQPHYLHTAL